MCTKEADLYLPIGQVSLEHVLKPLRNGAVLFAEFFPRARDGDYDLICNESAQHVHDESANLGSVCSKNQIQKLAYTCARYVNLQAQW